MPKIWRLSWLGKAERIIFEQTMVAASTARRRKELSAGGA